MRIAVIGWGSLISEPGTLRLADGIWHVGGPSLPIELSRLSDRRRHLTFVIDTNHPRTVPTRFAMSQYGSIEDAVADLACREGCAAHAIGFTTSDPDQPFRSRTEAVDAIRGWLTQRHEGAEAAVWTDLKPRFDGPFSLEAGIAWWKRLPPEIRDAAATYVQTAPPEVDTDLRRRLVEEGLVRAAR